MQIFIFCRRVRIDTYIVCPHYDEKERKSFDYMIREKKKKVLLWEAISALVYENNEFRIIRADKSINAYLFKNGIKKKLVSIDI